MLSSQTELCDDRTVAFDIVLLEVAEKVTSMTYHLVQTAAAVMVLLVCLQVLSESVDSVSQDRDLYFGGSCVTVMNLVLFDKSCLLFLCDHFVHLIIFLFSPTPQQRAGEMFSYENLTPKAVEQALTLILYHIISLL